jgi:hypothetical protein
MIMSNDHLSLTFGDAVPHSISMKIDLPPETEASLAARAAAEGISLPEYVT